MSLRARARVADDEARSIGPPGGWADYLAHWTGPERVTDQSALRHSAAFACQRILVSTVSKMPVDVFRQEGDAQVPVPAPPGVANQSGGVSGRGWVAERIRSGTESRNMYGRIVAWDARFMPTQIETVAPSDVVWRPNGEQLVPVVGGKEQTLWPNGDFWHVPVSQFLMPGSPVAISPTEYAQLSLSTGLAAEEFGNRFFADGGHPTRVWVADNDPGQEQLSMYADAIEAKSRPGSRRPLVVGSGIKPMQLQLDPLNTQWIDIMRFEIENAARFWGVPPSMIYSAVSGQSVTYANVSQADLAFLKTAVEAWIIDLEDAWSSLLQRPRFVKFNTDAVLRMDTQTRYRVHEDALRARVASVNELRA